MAGSGGRAQGRPVRRREGELFFQIGAHYDPLPLFTHFYHWFELARMDREPHPNERTLADFARQIEVRNEPFRLKDFFDRLNAIDSIPISLARWEMTGLDDEIRALTASK